jgi:protease-4
MSNYFPTFKRLMRKKLFRRSSLRKIALIIMLIASFIIIKDQIEYSLSIGSWSDDSDYINNESEYGECNVKGILLRGELALFINESSEYMQSSSEDIVYAIKEAEEDANIKAILIEVDSHGGYPVADEEIANALIRAKKPTIALVRGLAASASYYAITGADIIFASQDSEVGSIGVTASYLDYFQMNEKEGVNFNILSTGKYKDIMSEDKELTEDEKELILRDLNIMNDNFIQAVATNRDLDVEKVRSLADGSTMLGKMAMEAGLIDRIGGEYEVKDYLKDIIGEEVNICW